MPVSRIEINGVDLYVTARGVGRAAARLIVRERVSSNGWRKKTNRYLYLVYRAGDKIKEHYIAKLSDEKI